MFFRPSSTIWIAHREQQFLLVIYFVLDKKESRIQVKWIHISIEVKSLSQRVDRKIFNFDENSVLNLSYFLSYEINDCRVLIIKLEITDWR